MFYKMITKKRDEWFSSNRCNIKHLMGELSEEKVFIEVEFPQMQENEEIKMIKRKATF